MCIAFYDNKNYFEKHRMKFGPVFKKRLCPLTVSIVVSSFCKLWFQIFAQTPWVTPEWLTSESAAIVRRL